MKEGKVISYADLSALQKLHANERIIFVSGTYDLLHPGHVHFFELCKEYGILVVGVGCDADIKRYKGKERPILTEDMRLKLVSSLAMVDYAFLTYAPPPGESHFLDGLAEIFQKLQPDIYAVNGDVFDAEYRQELAKKHNVAMKVFQHGATCPAKGLSTTAIIQRIIGGKA